MGVWSLPDFLSFHLVLDVISFITSLLMGRGPFAARRDTSVLNHMMDSMPTTTKADLIAAVRERSGLSWPRSAILVEQVFETVVHELEQGETVKLSGFGVFSVRSKRPRPGRNPKTGEPIEITSRKVVTFRSSPLVLKDDSKPIS